MSGEFRLTLKTIPVRYYTEIFSPDMTPVPPCILDFASAIFYTLTFIAWLATTTAIRKRGAVININYASGCPGVYKITKLQNTGCTKDYLTTIVIPSYHNPHK